MLNPPVQPIPLWMKVVIIISVVPVLQVFLLAGSGYFESDQVRVLLWCYPLYVALSGYLAWRCYPGRREMSWILVVLMWLSHAAMWILSNQRI